MKSLTSRNDPTDQGRMNGFNSLPLNCTTDCSDSTIYNIQHSTTTTSLEEYYNSDSIIVSIVDDIKSVRLYSALNLNEGKSYAR